VREKEREREREREKEKEKERESTGETDLCIHTGKSERLHGNFDDTSLTSLRKLRNKDPVPVSVKCYVPQLSMLSHVCDTAGKGSRSSAVSGHGADGWKGGSGGEGGGGGGGMTMDMPPDIDGPDERTLEQMFEDVL
jgi:hypothetical protein